MHVVIGLKRSEGLESDWISSPTRSHHRMHHNQGELTQPREAGYPTGMTLALAARTCVSWTWTGWLGLCAFFWELVLSDSSFPFPSISLPSRPQRGIPRQTTPGQAA